MLPRDLEVMRDLWRARVPFTRAASPIDPDALVQLFFAHAIKWPGAVRAFVAASPAEGGQLSGKAIVQGIRAALRWADGRPLTRMHLGMSKGLMHAVSGLVVVSQQLGILRKGAADAPGRSLVSLGSKGTRYVLVAEDETEAAEQYGDAVLAAARAASPELLARPSVAELPRVASALQRWASEARRIQICGVGLVGGGEPAASGSTTRKTAASGHPTRASSQSTSCSTS